MRHGAPPTLLTLVQITQGLVRGGHPRRAIWGAPVIVGITVLANNGRQGALIDKARWELRLPIVGGFIGIVNNVDRFRKLIILVVAGCHDAPLSGVGQRTF